MGSLIYKRKAKVALVLIQMAAVWIISYCVLNLGFWMEDSYSLQELSKSYEETELFFRQVNGIVHSKINGQKNQELFGEDGIFDGGKEIDIQSYGKKSSGVKDMNTTYLLSDLLDFAGNGGLQALQSALAEATADERRQAAGEKLDGQADQLETIRPVTGISLAECSRWYTDSAGFVLNMYTRLAQVSQEIYTSYQQYCTEQDESWSREAPSNLRYYVENTATGEQYTNLDADSYRAALSALEGLPEFTPLYEGERSFNIMVANAEGMLNNAAEKWFLDRRFVNTNERVLLAVNRSYPVSDALQLYAGYFANREGIIRNSVFGAAAGLLVLLAGFAGSVIGAGWREGRLAPKLHRIDRIPTELAAGIYVIIAVLMLFFLDWKLPDPQEIYTRERLIWSVIFVLNWLLILSAGTSFARRARSHLLWHNSILRMLLYTWKKVTAARAASGQLLFFYVIFFSLNFLFLVSFGRVGIFMVLVLDMSGLLYLLRDMAGKQSIWEGIHQISKGDLSYKIDTTTLTGETYEMAAAVNEMGDGLQKAIDAIVKNERLKAELITNVSHDLKTPLTSIVNYVDLLKREHLEGERVQRYIEVLDQKSQRLKQLTEDLVEASRISSGNVELHMIRIQVQSMLRQAYGEFEERLEERQLTAVWEMPREPMHIMADGRQFWRVLENLLGNICKYALEGSRIYITVVQEGDCAVIEIKNTSGEKISIEADELTGRFVRGDRSRNTEGSGLGLSIAQNLTRLQGGEFALTVDGDLFKVTLRFPAAKEEESVKMPDSPADF